MLSVAFFIVMLRVILLNVVMLSVILLNVVASFCDRTKHSKSEITALDLHLSRL